MRRPEGTAIRNSNCGSNRCHSRIRAFLSMGNRRCSKGMDARTQAFRKIDSRASLHGQGTESHILENEKRRISISGIFMVCDLGKSVF